MKRRLRLRRQADFAAAMGGRRFFSGKALIAFAVPAHGDVNRIGVTVSRQVKGSVAKNRARRRLRELARMQLLAADSPLGRLGIRYDVVLIARPAALELPFADLRAEAEEAALRLSRPNP